VYTVYITFSNRNAILEATVNQRINNKLPVKQHVISLINDFWQPNEVRAIDLPFARFQQANQHVSSLKL
jgi:hypothetical protein